MKCRKLCAKYGLPKSNCPHASVKRVKKSFSNNITSPIACVKVYCKAVVGKENTQAGFATKSRSCYAPKWCPEATLDIKRIIKGFETRIKAFLDKLKHISLTRDKWQ